MKKILFFLTSLLSIIPAFSQNLKVSVDYSSYATSQMDPYIEFVFIVGGNTVNYVQTENKQYQAEVEIKVLFEKEDRIVDSLHFILASDLYSDTLTEKYDFADIINFKVPNGHYILYFSMKDVHSGAAPLNYIDNIEVDYPKDAVSSSDVKLLSSLALATEDDFFVKYGYSIPPLYNNFVPESINFLPYYMELYNSEKVLGQGSQFIVKSSIVSLSNKWINFQNLDFSREYPAAPLTVVTHQFNITSLPSGNYNLVVEVMDADSTLLVSNTVFFQRSNPNIELDITDYENVGISNSFVAKMNNLKELQDNVASLYPLATPVEREFFNKRMTKIPLDQLQRFFYSFWIERAPNDPEKAWNEYKKKVEFVQQKYGSKLVKGYRTERGRVYLQYGPPNSIKESPFSPTIYPYEIWHYYYIEGQTNVKFVFYNPEGPTNEYDLIHSDKIGEIRDPAWQQKLMKGRHGIENFDVKKPDNFWGNDMDENWRNP